MKTIWKAVIRPNPIKDAPYELRVPACRGAKAISVAVQNSSICVWFEIDIEQPEEDMILYSVGTGFGAINTESVRFIGTVIQGSFVWHIYADN